MLNKDYTTKIIDLQDVIVTKVENIGEIKYIYIELERKEHICPCCGGKTNTIHDYRKQPIKDVAAFGKNVVLILRKRRYRCSCGKRFAEQNSFVPRYYRMTSRLIAHILNKLSDERSFSSVARECNTSVSTVIRIFDCISYPKAKIMPEAVGIDEFKGNTNGEKYQCILTDLSNGKVIDIMPTRFESDLCTYFKSTDRSKVKYFVSDMWTTYSQIAKTYFKASTYVVDKYHWIRQVIWAFEAVRKEEQKKFSSDYRKYFKRSRSLLLKRFNELTDEQKQQVNIMLYASPNISNAYFLKEDFLKILDCENRKSAKKAMSDWISWAEESDLKRFEKCAETMQRWSTGILNSFDCKYTNGFTEGCNNKIKVLKRNAYGYRNGKRFRNRILHMFASKSAG